MPVLTFRDIKTKTRIPKALGLCPDDVRLPGYINEACQRLVTKGLWIGTYGRFRMCVTEGCLTLPGQIATVEKMAVCGRVIPTHDMWYEFLDNGFGPRNTACNGNSGSGVSCSSNGCGLSEANLRGWFPVFNDIRGTAKKLRLVCDVADDVGKKVLLLGYDQNGNWIRTKVGDDWQDGETVELAQSPGVDSTNFFDGGVTGVQFIDDREGQVWMWELNTADSTQRLIGSYQYWETNPSYPRYYIPSVLTQQQTEGSCALTTVEVIARLEFIPVAKDSDYVMLTSIPALKEMCVGIKKAEDEADSATSNDIIIKAEATAIRELDSQIEHYLGTGREIGFTVKGSNIGTVRPVETLL